MLLETYYRGYRQYLQLEKNLSANTIDAYLRDIKKIDVYCEETGVNLTSLEADTDFFQGIY